MFVSLGKKKKSCTYRVSFGASADYTRSLQKKKKRKGNSVKKENQNKPKKEYT